MRTVVAVTMTMLLSACGLVFAGERIVVSLRDFSTSELKYAGLDVKQPVSVHIQALGAGGPSGWSHKGDHLFAYGWIINADTRGLVWKMGANNTSRSEDDRSFDGMLTLQPGRYEAYFTAHAFAYRSTFTDVTLNVDHRESPLFSVREDKKKGFLSWFKSWWSGDIVDEWKERSARWGVDLLVDDAAFPGVSTFPLPARPPHAVFRTVGLGENALIRQGFVISSPATVEIYAFGEMGNENELADYGWIVDTRDRTRVWEMTTRNASHAGGARKNIQFKGQVQLGKGEYVLYYVTDDSHSAEDWNEAPPYDPLNYGVTISVPGGNAAKNFKTFAYDEDKNLIVGITKVRDDESRSEGFTLAADSRVRVYAFGERGSSRRQMADYGIILNAKTRAKVWAMDVDRTMHAGGGSKNRYVDEMIVLPKGSYIVTYHADDSHAYDDWNVDPPFDPEHYGISIMGAGEKFKSSVVGKYVEQRDKNIVAQIVRIGDDVERSERFVIDRTTKVRVYAIGEGRDREMYDYGWIEDTRTGAVVWEMTYSMTFYAGGGRKNRMVNTTIMLDKGEYRLFWRSDDSHSYSEWNVDPPEDAEYWGITLYKGEGVGEAPAPPEPPEEPAEPEE